MWNMPDKSGVGNGDYRWIIPGWDRRDYKEFSYALAHSVATMKVMRSIFFVE